MRGKEPLIIVKKMLSNAPFLLGVDLGTSNCKTIIINADGYLISKASASYPVYRPKVSWAEENPNDWWNAVVKTIRNCVKKAKISKDDIVGLSVVSHQEAYIPLDERGNELGNGILWIDQRIAEQLREIRKLISSKKVLEITGLQVYPPLVAPQLMWIKKNMPKIFEKARVFLPPESYIAFKLTDEYATDPSMASRTMLFDIRKHKWSEEICGMLGIPISILPPVKDAWNVLGEISSENAKMLGLKKGTPVAVGASDNQCEALGTNVVKPKQLCINTGTGSCWMTPLTEPKLDFKGKLNCMCHVLPNTWIYEIGINATGSSLDWFKNNMGCEEIERSRKRGINPYELFDKFAEEIEPGCDGLFYYPYLCGSRAPKFNPLARGVFFGLVYGHTKAHLIRSILEGVAFQYIGTFEILEDAGVRIEEIAMVGGETNSEIWTQMKADILNQRIKVPVIADAAAFGSAILAGVATDVYKDLKFAAENLVKWKKTYEPREEIYKKYREIYRKYDRIYEIYKEAYNIYGEAAGSD
jgi:xylulokinase